MKSKKRVSIISLFSALVVFLLLGSSSLAISSNSLYIGNSAYKASKALSAASASSATSTAVRGISPGGGTSQTAQPPSTEATKKTKKEITLEISGLGDPILLPNKDLTVQVRAKNNTKEKVVLENLELLGAYVPATTQTAVYNWMRGTSQGKSLLITSQKITLAAGESKEIKLVLPAEKRPWSTEAFAWGARGIEVKATLAGNKNSKKDNALSDRSFITVASSSTDITPMPVSILLPVTAGMKHLEDTPEITELLAEVAKKNTQSNSATPENGKIIQKEILNWDLEGVTALADPAFLYDKKISLSKSVLKKAELQLLPNHDVDFSALAHIGKVEEARQIVDNTALVGKNLGADFSLNYALLEGKVDIETLNLVAKSGLSKVIMEDRAAPIERELYYTPSPYSHISLEAGELDTLLFHSAISSALSGKINSPDGEESLPLSDLDAQQTAIALSAVHFGQAPNYSRPILVQVARGLFDCENSGSEKVRRAVQALLQAPWLRPVPLENIESGNMRWLNSENIPDQEINAGELTINDFSQLQRNKSEFAEVTQSMDNPAPFTSVVNNYSERIFATGWRQNPTTRQKTIKQLSPQKLLSGIKVEETSTINMISDTAELPLHIANPFPVPMRVTVKVKVPDTRLKIPEKVDTELRANGTTTVPIPVQARGSGNVQLEVKILNASGKEIGTPASLDMRIRASWENTGTLVLAIIVGTVLITGIAKSVRSGRRAQHISNS